MSALAQTTSNTPSESNITSISTNARIDYIHRFSKQAVLIVEQDTAVTSDVIGNFLGALPDNKNTAYISVSPQHSNIQIRCRIVEQLFGNMLFDPEKSLAVTVLNFAKSAKQPISILIDNTQSLTLQIIHELCQLAELAKKGNMEIDVIMFGLPSAGSLVSKSKSLFTGKLSILSGSNGQLLSFNAAMFKEKRSWLKISSPAKWLISTILLVSACFAVFMNLYEKGAFNTSDLIASIKTNVDVNNGEIESEPTFVAITEHKNISRIGNVIPSAPPKKVLANTVDVFNALSQKQRAPIEMLIKSERRPAIFETNKRIEHKAQTKLIAKSQVLTNEVTISDIKSERRTNWALIAVNPRVSPEYYQAKATGFVIQFSAFTEYERFQKFTALHQLNDYHGYLRILNGQTLLVITSDVFATSEEAKARLKAMPAELINEGIWIKPISSIKSEIARFSTAIN